MKRIIITGLILVFSFLFASTFLGSSTASAVSAANCSTNSTFFGLPPWYKYLNPHIDPETGGCELDFKFPEGIAQVMFALAEILLRVAAIVALVFVIIGGVRYTTSQGEPDATASARKTILNALIGLVLAVSAAAIVTFIGGRFK
jgi:hypothetical protein